MLREVGEERATLAGVGGFRRWAWCFEVFSLLFTLSHTRLRLFVAREPRFLTRGGWVGGRGGRRGEAGPPPENYLERGRWVGMECARCVRRSLTSPLWKALQRKNSVLPIRACGRGFGKQGIDVYEMSAGGSRQSSQRNYRQRASIHIYMCHFFRREKGILTHHQCFHGPLVTNLPSSPSR